MSREYAAVMTLKLLTIISKKYLKSTIMKNLKNAVLQKTAEKEISESTHIHSLSIQAFRQKRHIASVLSGQKAFSERIDR